MKILTVGHFNSFATSKPHVEMLIGLKKKGVDVKIVSSSRGPVIDYLKENGIEIFDHHPKKKVDRESINILSGLLASFKPDIFFLLNSKSIPNGIRAAKGVDVKVVTYRGAAGLYWHDPTSYLTHLNPRVDAIVCVSKFVEENVRKQFFLSKPRTKVIMHGFDVSWYTPREQDSVNIKGISEGEIVIGCVANVRPVKGVKYLIKAARKFKNNPNVKFLLIGSGMESLVRNDAGDSAGSEQFIIPGFVENLKPYFRLMDIYVQPSLKEGSGKSIVEAMSNGIPVIATKSGGPEEIIQDGKSGLLVATKSSKELAEAIQRLMDSADLRKQLGQGGKERIMNDFPIEKMISQYYEFFTDLNVDK